MSIPRNLSILADNASSTGVLSVAGGGTGLSTMPTNGQLDIGNGTGFTRAAITAGTGISVTNGAGSITIAASGGSSPVQASPITVTASSNLTMTTGGGGSAVQYSRVITLDVNRELVIHSTNDLTDNIAAFVYNSSTNTFGAVAAIRTGASSLGAILIATDKVLLVSVGTGGTALEAVVLSISTNTITVNTAATATLGGVLAALNGSLYYSSLVTVGTSYVLSYGRATTTSAIRAFTVSGTTVTIGSESVLTPATTNAAALFSISSSVVLALSASSTVIYATPYTVSGVTLTVGTGATQSITGANWFPTGVFQSGQISFLYQNTTHYGGIVSVSGTTATISTVQIWSSTGANTSAQYYAAIVGDKMMCMNVNGGLANLLTNTSGTASAGTEIPMASGAGQVAYINGIFVSFASSNSYKYSISGSNIVEAVNDTYAAQSSGTMYIFQNYLGKVWTGSSLVSLQIYRSATKTISNSSAASIYLNSDGTTSPTVAKLFGITNYFINPNEGATAWQINYRTATTVMAIRTTLS